MNCLIIRIFMWILWPSSLLKKKKKRKRQSETRVLTLYKEIAMKFANISVVLYDKCFLPAFMQSALCFFSISLGEWRIEEIGERANERMSEWEDEPLNETRAKSAPRTTNWYAASGCDSCKGVWVGVCTRCGGEGIRGRRQGEFNWELNGLQSRLVVVPPILGLAAL